MLLPHFHKKGRLVIRPISRKYGFLLTITLSLTALAPTQSAGALSILPPAGSKQPPPPPGSVPQEPWPEELAPYLPTGLSDPRLRRDLAAAPGTKSFNSALTERYGYELCRYATKLVKEKKYQAAIPFLDLSIKLNQTNQHIALQLRAETLLILAKNATPTVRKRYLQQALADADSMLKNQDADIFTILKLQVLTALGRKQEAIDCCTAAFIHAQIFGRDTAKLSAYHLRLTGKSKPDNISAIRVRDVPKVRAVILSLIKNGTRPNLVYGRRDHGALFPKIDLFHPSDNPKQNAIYLMVNSTTAAVTPAMVKEWLAQSDVSSLCQVSQATPTSTLKAIYPWGELNVDFNNPDFTASCLTFKEGKTAEAKEVTEQPTLSNEDEGRPATFAQNLSKIDKLLDTGHYDDIIALVDTTLSWAGNPSTKATKDAIRPRLVRMKEAQNKSNIAAYLREAPFSQIVLLINKIQLGERNEFFTPDEYASKKYYLKGKMNEDYSGSCEIWGGRDFAPLYIQGKTEAAVKLFSSLKIELPFDYDYQAHQIAPPSGLMIDAILDEESDIATKNWLETQKEAEEKNLVH